jgi:hypothetical protein
VITSAIYREKPGTGSGGPAPRRRTTCPPKLRLLTLPAGVAGLMLLASACTSGPPHRASVAAPRPRHSAAAAPASRPEPTLAASQPAAAASPGTGTTVPEYTGPHFDTPQAAMTYLAAAYNSDDTTALQAVTGAEAFTSLQDMRASDLDLQLVSCWPRRTGDYVCSVRYNTSASSPHPGTSRVAMLIAAPALDPGWYMYQFLSGCD